MKKTLLILCALLLTSIGANAQEVSTEYEFKNTDWVGVSGRDADEGQVTYGTDDSNTITVTATGANNIALFNGSAETSVNTTNYYITSDQKYFVVIGSDLNTQNTDNTYSQLWWMNGVGGPTAKPDYVMELTDETGDATGEVLFAWDLTTITEFSSVLTPDGDGHITLNGWTGFGLTTTETSSTISYIGFYTEDELDELLTTKPYEFNAEDWVVLDDHINSELNGTTTVTYGSGSDGTANTITVTYTGTNAGLGNMGTMDTSGANTAGYYVTAEQKWFVIQGTGLSTTGHTLWWMNGHNEGMSIAPTEVATLVEDGSVVLAWDLSKSQAGTNLQNDMNTLSGGTCFGLIAENSSSGFTITDINFYTEAEVEELIATAIKPYEFNASDWVALGDHTGTTVTPNTNDNTISVSYDSTNTEAGLSNSATATNDDTTLGVTTGKYYVTKEQCWFVIVGEGLSTNNSTNNYDSQLWWMNGANYGTWYPTKVETLSDGQVLLAWDLSTMDAIDVNLQDESDLLDGWTCFGLKAASGNSFTISDINFYTADEVEEISSGYDHFCTANIEHWTLKQTGSGTNGALELDTWADQSDEKMSTPFLQYYVWEGEDGTTYLSDATISHEQLTGLTPGMYEVSMDIRIIDYAKDEDGNNANVTAGTKFIANGVSEDLLTGNDGKEDDYDTNGHDEVYGTYTLTCVVDETGTLDISLDVKDATYSWIMFKNLSVTYAGEVTTETITWTMTEAGWGTIILPFAADVPEGLTAYSCASLEEDETTLDLTPVTDGIAANTPYILSGTAAEYTFSGVATNTQDTYTAGLLTGTFVKMDYTALSAVSGIVYLLQNHQETDTDYEDGEGTGIGFYPVTSDSAPNETTGSEGASLDAYHCYLTLDSSTSGSGVRAYIGFPDSGEETGIEAVEGDVIAEDAIYDLSGRRVAKAVKGVYIQNGKKVLVK